MKKISLTLSLIAATTLMGAEAPAVQAEDGKSTAMEGVKYIKMLGKELKGELKRKMKEDPTGLQAAYFCAKSAQELTRKVNAAFPEGVKVRRTALKLRNTENKPDATDLKIMKEMEAAVKKGTFKKKPVVVEVDGTRRVYVPLLVEKACLKCHGPAEKIDPKVKELLSKKYPEDKAIGFREGDLRGVIVAELPPKKQ